MNMTFKSILAFFKVFLETDNLVWILEGNGRRYLALNTKPLYRIEILGKDRNLLFNRKIWFNSPKDFFKYAGEEVILPKDGKMVTKKYPMSMLDVEWELW